MSDSLGTTSRLSMIPLIRSSSSMNILLWVPPPSRRGRRTPHPLMIGIPIAAMQQPTIAVWDISDLPVRGFDGKRPRRFDHYPPHMCPRARESLGNHCPHHIPGLVAKDAPAPLAAAGWKPQLDRVTQLASTMTRSLHLLRLPLPAV